MTAARPCGTTISAQVQGTIGNTVTVSQFDQHGKEYVTDHTTSLINGWSDCNVGHTFAIPGHGRVRAGRLAERPALREQPVQ